VFTVALTRSPRPVGVLLGGTGRARLPAQRSPRVAVLLRPTPSAITPSCVASENRAEVAASC